MTTSTRAAHAGLLDAHLNLLAEALLPYRAAEPLLARWGTELAGILVGGGRLLVAGNGGSAAEAQHLTAELVGRLRDDRQPLSAIALHAETSALTAIGNDYGYDEVFARQVRAHGRPGDVLLLMSTSGASGNLLAAVDAARETGLRCWAFTGPAPNPLAGACHEALTVASPDSQVVQELHLVSTHVLCEYVDRALPTALAALAGQTAAVTATRSAAPPVDVPDLSAGPADGPAVDDLPDPPVDGPAMVDLPDPLLDGPAAVDRPGSVVDDPPVAEPPDPLLDGPAAVDRPGPAVDELPDPVVDELPAPPVADGGPVRTGVEVVVDGVDPAADGHRGDPA